MTTRMRRCLSAGKWVFITCGTVAIMGNEGFLEVLGVIFLIQANDIDNTLRGWYQLSGWAVLSHKNKETP